MRSRRISRPFSSATISILVPPRSMPKRMLETRFRQLRSDELLGIAPVLGAKMRCGGRREQRLEAFIPNQMNAQDIRRDLGGRGQVLRNVVNEEGWPSGLR